MPSHYPVRTESSTLHIIAEPEANTERSFDIVALHGPGGSWNKTWTCPMDNHNFLLSLLSTQYPSSRIISINHPVLLHSLATCQQNNLDLIRLIIKDRQTTRRTHRPIIFIGHSLGGSLLKHIFVATHPSRTSREDFRNLHKCVKGYVFFGTPQKHVDVRDYAALWRGLQANCEGALGGSHQDLKRAFEALSVIDSGFLRLGGEGLPAVCFYETLPTFVGIHQCSVVTKQQTLYASRPVSCEPLALKHQALGQIPASVAEMHHRIMSRLQDLRALIEDSDHQQIRQRGVASKRLVLLSLDGGGVRGLFSVLVLQALLCEVDRLLEVQPSQASKRPCGYFDLIGGTSTGGLLAIMLGRLRMDIQSCIDAYKAMSVEVFSRPINVLGLPFTDPINTAFDTANIILGNAYFSGDKLKATICRTVGGWVTVQEKENLDAAGLGVEDVRLLSTEPLQTRTFVCAVREGQHRVERLRTYVPTSFSGNESRATERDMRVCSIWQAGRATSAAPTYFPAISIHGRKYFDGGLHSNNPVLEVIDEAQSEFPENELGVIVSIGTGQEAVSDPVGHVSNVVLSLLGRLTNTEAQDEVVMTERRYERLREGYFRFQDHGGLGKIDLAGVEKMREIERLAEEYLGSETGRNMIERCGARMAQCAGG